MLTLPGAFPDPLPEKHGAPASCPLKGCGVEAVSQIPRLLRDWDADSAVASPACLGMEASVVGWLGMRTIWRRASVTPLRKERLVKPGSPSKPWPQRTPASPAAWPSCRQPTPLPCPWAGSQPQCGTRASKPRGFPSTWGGIIIRLGGYWESVAASKSYRSDLSRLGG
jgi:hypothetical protein